MRCGWCTAQFFVRRTIESLKFLKCVNDIASISGHLFPIFPTSETGYRHVMLLFGSGSGKRVPFFYPKWNCIKVCIFKNCEILLNKHFNNDFYVRLACNSSAILTPSLTL